MNPQETTALVPPPTQDQQGDETEKNWIIDQFYGGISDTEKQIVRTTYLLEKQYQFYFSQNCNILNDGGWLQLNHATVLDSAGVTFAALPRWAVSGAPYNNNVYFYCANGDMYQRDQNGKYTYLFTAQDSQGNGLAMWQGYLYYTTNSSIGIWGPINTPNVQSPQTHNDAYLAQGFNNTANTGIAPLNTDLPFLTVGHGNSVGKFDGTNWTANALTVPVGSYVRSFDLANQMLGIATAAGPGTLNNNVGYIFFWDGANYTYNTYVTHVAGVDTILNNKNRLLSITGSNGLLYQNISPFQSLMRFPKMLYNESVQIHPGSVTNYKGQAMMGIAESTTSANLKQGVYRWGNRNDNYPEGMGFDYTISTGNTQNISMGALLGTGTELFIAWQDNNTNTIGIDMVSDSNPYYTSGFMEGVIIDDMRPVDSKNLLTVKSSHLPLNTGEGIQLGFKINRASSYMLSTTDVTTGATFTKLPIPQDFAQFNEAQCKVILSGNGKSTPTVTTLGAAYMPQLTQSQY